MIRFTRWLSLHTRNAACYSPPHSRPAAASAAPKPMRLKLYCNRYEHFKDALVCSVNCAYRTRCRDFALFYDERREDVDGAVAAYYESHRAPAVVAPDAPAQKK